MNKVNILPDNLANQIAAGEVVERPASVVKELVENSIDAGASRIQVDIELGGRRLIRVSDDGEGMSRDDALLGFERHATSKIRSLEDLAAIGTLGFRGEALASIASVAKVELLTKTEADDIATMLQIEGGRLMDVKDAARNRGTTISVRDLFYNTPARRKFMRSEATENFHLTNIIQHYALANPQLALKLTSNGREILDVSSAKDLRERTFQIFGGGLLESLLPVRGGRDFVVKLSGYVSAPRERRTTRDAQYFFVNGRFVRDKTITAGLREGFRSVLPHGVYPVALLFLDIPLDEVDVNVHPAKTEIRFRRTEAVKDAIAESIRNSLSSAGIVPEIEPPSTDRMSDTGGGPPSSVVDQPLIAYPTSSENGATDPVFPVANGFGTKADQDEFSDVPFNNAPAADDPAIGIDAALDFAASLAAEAESRAAMPPASEPIINYQVPEPTPLPPLNSGERYLKAADPQTETFSGIKPLAQIRDSFIIAVDSEGMLLIDQHVAHERILFDKFRKQESGRQAESQNLLLPETLDLTPAQAEAFHLVESDLEALGFGLMRLSGRTVAIKSIPTDVQPGEARNLFADILDSIDVDKRGRAKTTIREDVAASLACKAAVKINMKLTQEKMQWMIDRLVLTDSPTTCPHGRPIILRLSIKDIERGFHRT
jgi:DNA mismatch repair protein MutL